MFTSISIILLILYSKYIFFLSNKKIYLESGLMNLSKNWYLITYKSGLHRVHELLQELNIGAPINPLIYVRFGYKMLSAQDKETYYLLKDLSIINYNKTAQPTCSASIDYLSIALGTNESTQIHRIKKLEKHKLLKTTYNGSFYIFNPPYPDSTFVSTIVKLIRRKRLGELIRLYHSCNNPLSRIKYLTEINDLKSIGTTHSKLKTVTSINYIRPYPEEYESDDETLTLLQTLARVPSYKVS